MTELLSTINEEHRQQPVESLMLYAGTADMNSTRARRTPPRSQEELARWENLLETWGITEEQATPPLKDDRYQVGCHFALSGTVRKSMQLWAMHLGTAGVGDLARVMILRTLRELGRPPGWVGKWDPEDLL